ncbi:MAG: hypothetical protein KDA80_17685 [Planctomycetaceae bacterium]|nr:hypothetical protein [Planctomycetaceae bacterium]
MRRIAFFEDGQNSHFGPLTQLRPNFELLCGHFSVRERGVTLLKPESWGVFCREELAEVYREDHSDAHVNEVVWINEAPTLLINGRWLGESHLLANQSPGTAGWIGNTLAFLVTDPTRPLPADFSGTPAELASLAYDFRHVDTEGALLTFPWDLVSRNAEQLARDFAVRRRENSIANLPGHLAVVGDESRLFVHESAQVDPYVVIDVTGGPVWIEADVKIQAFTRIEGPCFVGRGTQLFRANVREGCSFGPVCRIGGEIEESIVQGYSNKYHDGFLGHSVVGEWVNFGALTTNSDLKNDYSDVSVPLSGVKLDTGSKKVGCFIGDHTKTALSSLFNTGTSVGVMSLILPGGELLPKHIPSFSRVWHGRIEALPDGVESGLATARYAMSRRDRELTPTMEQLLLHVYASTQAEREASLAWQAEKQVVRQPEILRRRDVVENDL